MDKKSFERIYTRIGRIFVLFVFFILFIGLLEIAARHVYEPPPVRRVYDPFSHKIPKPNLIEYFKVTNDVDEWVSFKLNGMGMRGPALDSPSDTALTLVFLGGSTTENYRYNDKDTFPVLIGKFLENVFGKPVRVFNAGMSSGTTQHSLARFQNQALDLKPHLVIVYHGINDLISGFNPEFRADGRHLEIPQSQLKPYSSLLSWIKIGNRNVDFTTDEPYGVMVKPKRPSHEISINDYSSFPALAAFSRNIKSMAVIAEGYSVPILFLTQGTMYDAGMRKKQDNQQFIMTQSLINQGIDPPDIKSLALRMKTFNSYIMKMETSKYVHTFDAASHLPKDRSVFYDDCHLTKKGNIVMAEIIAPIAARIILK